MSDRRTMDEILDDARLEFERIQREQQEQGGR